jgi:hypothetical protein
MSNWYEDAKRGKKPKKEEYDWKSMKSKWIPVESSFVSHAAYWEPLGFFEIKLKSGKQYLFKKVPKDVFDKFMSAKSKGKFLNEHIFGGKYKYESS